MQIELLYHSPLWLCANAIRMSHDNHNLSDSAQINPDHETCPRCNSYLLSEGDECGLELWCPKCSEEMQTSFYFRLDEHIGYKDKELIHRVGNKLKHKSVLEQLVYWFDIDGISRACLQELARHRTARLTVKSTRYTLKELRNEQSFVSNEKTKGWLIVNGTDGSTVWHDIDRAEKYIVLTKDNDINASNIQALENIRFFVVHNKSNDISKYTLPEAFKTRLQWQIDMRNLQNFLELRLAKEALWEIRELARNIANELPNDHKYLVKDIVKEKYPEMYEQDNWEQIS